MKISEDQKYESFLKLYHANEKHIFRFILALLPNFSAAEDILQDTMLVMWRKFDQYSFGTNFAAWGMQIARLSVLQYYRKKRSGIVRFDSDVLEKIAEYEMRCRDQESPYAEVLHECSKRLPEHSRKVVSLRYAENMKIVDIAQKIGKTANSTYQIMYRIHHSLLKCIEQKLTERNQFSG